MTARGPLAMPIMPTAPQVNLNNFVDAWRATSPCFLVAFILIEGGRGQTTYLSGERDDNPVWARAVGHLTNDRVEADYVWHDLEKDQLNSQTCVFERLAPSGRGAERLPFMKHAANSREVIE